MHADTSNGARRSHLGFIRRAMDVNISPHGVNVTQPINAAFDAGQPQDSGEYPVARWISRTELGRVNLACRTPFYEYRVLRLAAADLGANDVPSAGRAETSVLFAGAVSRARNQILAHAAAQFILQFGRLRGQSYVELKHFRGGDC